MIYLGRKVIYLVEKWHISLTKWHISLKVTFLGKSDISRRNICPAFCADSKDFFIIKVYVKSQGTLCKTPVPFPKFSSDWYNFFSGGGLVCSSDGVVPFWKKMCAHKSGFTTQNIYPEILIVLLTYTQKKCR